ncbi:MAG: hypothetical protein LWX56_03560 [Ignavibacteria bacterium]|nr:hypothetical protein [Ignavibacteria bacterium]
MLKLGGYFNIVIAIAHIVLLIWADWMFKVTGITQDMARYAAINPVLPYAITVLVAIFFFLFGLYALTESNNIFKLPFVKPVIYIIAGIYLVRGVGGLAMDMMRTPFDILQLSYSLVALVVGNLYLFGGLQHFQNRNVK